MPTKLRELPGKIISDRALLQLLADKHNNSYHSGKIKEAELLREILAAFEITSAIGTHSAHNLVAGMVALSWKAVSLKEKAIRPGAMVTHKGRPGIVSQISPNLNVSVRYTDDQKPTGRGALSPSMLEPVV